jgi:cytochrome b561
MQEEASYLHPDLSNRDSLARSPAEAAPAYTIIARVLHWTTAFIILFVIPLGVVIANELGESHKDLLYDLHRSLGVVLIPILVLRLINRLARPPLPLPHDFPAMQRLAADMTH